MRTTITLDADVEELVKQAMRDRGLTFKETVNQAIRSGLNPRPRRRFRQQTHAMGFRPQIAHDKALQLAGELETEEILRKLSLDK